MEFRLLGPVEVEMAGAPVDIGPPRQRGVLAALAVDAGRPVPVATLVERVWGDATEPSRSALYVYVTNLRKVLATAGTDGPGTATVARRSGGYVLDVDPDRVDVHRFRRLAGEARQPGCPDPDRAVLLRQALDLWRGTPLADLPGGWPERLRQDWRQEYVEAATAWAGAALGTGDPGAAVDLLTELAGRYPLNESVAAALMRLLYATGRGAGALDHYERVRAHLADELGTDPGPELRALHRAVRRGEPVTAPRPRPPARSEVVPAQLPADLARFAGRADHLRQLDTLLTSGPETRAAAIAGTAGVGKTALAVHWAHRVADRFPDGQLYVNLRGFDPGGQVVDPATAVRGFLDAFQVPPQRIPADAGAQAAMYRGLLAGRRVLVVLDNARDSTQVGPLLPDEPGCLAVVTTRNQLTRLVADAGALPVTLDLLTPDEARELLSRRLGADRVAAEPDAVEQIITRCARLPLALTLVAAHAAVRPGVGLRVLADELRDSRHRWQTLTGDDPSTDLQAVFSWSYQALTPDAARLFRLLGLYPGPDLTAPAAASLAAVPVERVRPLLAELVRAHLLTEHVPGRYTLHDLLRAYAGQLTNATDPAEARHDATHRVLDHYLHTAYAAHELLDPVVAPITLVPRRPGVVTERPADNRQALDWFTAERAVLLAAVDHAAAEGFDTHTWRLAQTLWTYLDRSAHWHDWAATGRAVSAVAGRIGDPAAEAFAHRTLANAYTRLGRLDEASTELGQALDVAVRTGDEAAQAHAHHGLAYTWEQRGHPERALDHARQALDRYRSIGYEAGQSHALNAIGWCHALLGDHEEALAACQQALTLQQKLADRFGQANTWDSLGYIHHHLGHDSDAVDCYHRAVTLSREVGDRYNEAEALTHLGDVHRGVGDLPAARDAYRQAVEILTDLDHPDADGVRARLSVLTG